MQTAKMKFSKLLSFLKCLCLPFRVTVSPSCKLNLRSYPMDTQNCYFQLVSCKYLLAISGEVFFPKISLFWLSLGNCPELKVGNSKIHWCKVIDAFVSQR